MRKPRPWLVALLPLLLPVAGSAQEPGPEVSFLGPEPAELDPGTPTTLVFRVGHRNPHPLTLERDVVLPEGWHLANPSEILRLEAAESRIVLVAFSAPAATAPGRDHVRLQVRDDRGGPAAADTVAVSVRKRRDLDLTILRAPQYAKEGAPYSLEARVANRGNLEETVRIRADAPGQAATVDPATPVLAPGEARAVRVEVSPGGSFYTASYSVVQLEAVSSRDTSVRARATGRVLVLPDGGARKRDPSTGLSSSMTARMANAGGGVPPLEISGSGPVAGSSDADMSFTFRGPRSRRSAFGITDVYRMAYRSRHLQAEAGDRVFSLTPLTQRGRYGFGAEASGRTDGFEVGALVNGPRRGERMDTQWGAFSSYRYGEDSRVQLTYLGREEGHAWSLRNRVGLVDAARLDVEVATGGADQEAGQAYSLNLHGDGPTWSYQVKHLRAEDGYPGDTGGGRGGLKEDLARLSVTPVAGLHLEGSYQDHRRTSTDARPGFRLFRRVLGRAELAGAFGIQYESSTRAGRSAARAFRESSESAEAHLAGRAGPVDLRLEGELAWHRRPEEANPRTGRRVAVSGRVRRSGSATYLFRLEHFRGFRTLSRRPERSVAARFDVRLRPSESTELRVGLQGKRWEGRRARLHSVGHLTLRHRLPPGHFLHLRGRLRSSGPVALDDTELVLGYEVPLQLPLGASASGPRITGRVYDLRTGEGVADAVVHVGKRVAVTDGDGSFEVQGADPGRHYLFLDPASLPRGRIPARPMPLSVRLHRGSDAEINVPVAQPAGVEGEVRMMERRHRPSGDSVVTRLAEAGGVEGAMVVLHDGRETLRRVTDGEGRFSFPDIRPGQWTLRVKAPALRGSHSLEPEARSLRLEPGERKRIRVEAVPRQRDIQVVNHGRIATDP